jgi:hypothetical protein
MTNRLEVDINGTKYMLVTNNANKLNVRQVKFDYAVKDTQSKTVAKVMKHFANPRWTYFSVEINNQEWVEFRRPIILGWYVFIRISPQIVKVRRSILTRSFTAVFAEGWELEVVKKAFKHEFLFSISDGNKTCQGVAFFIAMLLCMESYTYELD